jgi:hypothetical protein
MLDAIDVLTVDPQREQQCGHFAGQACEQRIPPEFPEALALRFGVVERVRFEGLTVLRYRASKPVAVRPTDFVDRASKQGGLILFDESAKSAGRATTRRTP